MEKGREWLFQHILPSPSHSDCKFYLINFLFLCVEAQISSCVSEGSVVLSFLIANASQDIWFSLVLYLKSEWYIRNPCTDLLLNFHFMCFSCSFDPQIGLCVNPTCSKYIVMSVHAALRNCFRLAVSICCFESHLDV